MAKPSDFQAELLHALADLQDRYEHGDWDFQGTLWSRASFRLAKPRSADRPSPIPGKRNITDRFRARFGRAVNRLIAGGYVRRRSIRGSDRQPRFTLGYHNHKLRNRDIFLTAKGKAWVEAHRPAPSTPEDEPAPTGYEYVLVPARPRPKPAPKRPKRIYRYVVTLSP